MTWRRFAVLCVAAASGCWSDDPLVDSQFTADQWAHLQDEFRLPALTPPPALPAKLGRALFFDPGVSSKGTVSCATCHDPKNWFIDSRATNNVSLGVTSWTKHNSISLVNVGLKEQLAHGAEVYTAVGGFVRPNKDVVHFKSAGDVTELAVTGPMGSSHAAVATLLKNSLAYEALYEAAFGPITADDDKTFAAVSAAFDAYIAQLDSVNSRFDQYITGDAIAAFTDAEKRGFGVFVGRGMCIECHRTALFSDLAYHVTGVEQVGPNVPVTDDGRYNITKDDADRGKFLTAPLRQIAQTGPYMHDGSLGSLAEVIDFYRRGGGDSGYSGAKDPRMVASSMTDDDAHDLEAFLRTLTGAPVQGDAATPYGICFGVEVELQTDALHCGSCTTTCDSGTCTNGACAPVMTCTAMDGNAGRVCGGTCSDLSDDPQHCGSCLHACDPGDSCHEGVCIPTPPPPPPMCPVALTPCGQTCVDTANDPFNCGACGHPCGAQSCIGGQCV